MRQNRRNFLKKAPLLATTPLLAQYLMSCQTKTEEKTVAETTPAAVEEPTFKIEKFGIQLWTVKENMSADAKGTLQKLADAGYKQVESFQGEQGIFWGMQPKEFKTYLDELGMTCVSSHCNPAYTTDPKLADEFKKLADDAASVGIQYLINPFPGELKVKDEWQKVADGLNKQGEITKAAGIRTGYHNHHIEFLPLADGTFPEQLLIDGTNKDLVDFELDLYWIVKAEQDPKTWLEKNSGRFRLCHIKDLYTADKVKEIEKNEKSESTFWPLGASTFLGNGRIDFRTLLPVAQQHGMQYFIVEQERFDQSTPLDDAKKNAAYMGQFVS